MRGAIAISVGTILSLSSCSRAPEQDARRGSARWRSTPDAGTPGSYVVLDSSLERFIRYQDRVLELQAEMLPELLRFEQVDGGAAEVSVIRRQAAAEDRIRRDLGLTERDLEELEAIVGDVISRRARLSISDAQQTLREMEALAARLPSEQRAEFDATVAALRRQFDESQELEEQRKRYGAKNVERILAREKELTEQWNRAIAVFSGATQREGGHPGGGTALAPAAPSSAMSLPADTGARKKRRSRRR